MSAAAGMNPSRVRRTPPADAGTAPGVEGACTDVAGRWSWQGSSSGGDWRRTRPGRAGDGHPGRDADRRGLRVSAKTNQVIVVRGNRIESVGARHAAPAGATVIDLSQRDRAPRPDRRHTHVFLQGEDPAEGGYDAQLLK